jgi:hypothetical protein
MDRTVDSYYVTGEDRLVCEEIVEEVRSCVEREHFKRSRWVYDFDFGKWLAIQVDDFVERMK